MTRIKICGIREEAHALAVAEAGADFIGVVFAPSRRQITPDRARHIASVIKKRNHHVEVVGVFVNMPATEVNKVADFCALDWVQLSGDEPWEYCHEITKPIIKAIRISPQSPNVILSAAKNLNAELAAGAKLLSTQKFIALLDSQVEGTYGGTGLTFNWNLAQQVAKRFPIIIAGGLGSENVAQAIEMVLPWGVDVSSGVEIEGVKDAAKIRAFIETVRQTDEH